MGEMLTTVRTPEPSAFYRVLPAMKKADPKLFWWITVVADERVPEGVWCLTPRQGGLLHPDTMVGAISPEFQDEATRFARALAATRMQSLSPMLARYHRPPA